MSEGTEREMPSTTACGGDILSEASRLISWDRREMYGDAGVMYATVGRMWGSILGIPDIPSDTVLLMMAAMKVARQSVAPKRDNLVDAAGYLGLIRGV